MKLFAMFLVCLFAYEIQGFSDRKCGAQLTQLMWIVCDNGFNTRQMDKKSVHSNYALPSLEHDPSSFYNIFQLEEGSLMGKNRKTRMLGIVDECCKRTCKYSELQAYCL